MRRSIRNFNIHPPGIPRAFDWARGRGGGNLNVALEEWGI